MLRQIPSLKLENKFIRTLAPGEIVTVEALREPDPFDEVVIFGVRNGLLTIDSKTYREAHAKRFGLWASELTEENAEFILSKRRKPSELIITRYWEDPFGPLTVHGRHVQVPHHSSGILVTERGTDCIRLEFTRGRNSDSISFAMDLKFSKAC